MMSVFSEQTIIDSIRVTEMGAIEVRRADRVLRDGLEISRNFHRHVLAPGDPLDNEDARVAAVAEAVWTPEVVQAWQDFLASQQLT